MALFLIILNFLRHNLPNFSQDIAFCGIRILNRKKVGFVKESFSIFANYDFSRCEKTGLIDFSEKWAPTKVKHLPPVCKVSRNFTEGNARKFTVSFAFCAHVDVIKYRKTLTFSFERAQIAWAFVFSALVDEWTFAPKMLPRDSSFLKLATQKGNNLFCQKLKAKNMGSPTSFWREHTPKNTLHLIKSGFVREKGRSVFEPKNVAIISLKLNLPCQIGFKWTYWMT